MGITCSIEDKDSWDYSLDIRLKSEEDTVQRTNQTKGKRLVYSLSEKVPLVFGRNTTEDEQVQSGQSARCNEISNLGDKINLVEGQGQSQIEGQGQSQKVGQDLTRDEDQGRSWEEIQDENSKIIDNEYGSLHQNRNLRMNENIIYSTSRKLAQWFRRITRQGDYVHLRQDASRSDVRDLAHSYSQNEGLDFNHSTSRNDHGPSSRDQNWNKRKRDKKKAPSSSHDDDYYGQEDGYDTGVDDQSYYTGGADTDGDDYGQSEPYGGYDDYTEEEGSFRTGPGSSRQSQPSPSEPEDEDYDDMHEDNAFGYQFRSYLSGSPLINAFLTLWHLALLVFSAALLLAGAGVEFFFSYMVITQVKALPTFATYAHFMAPVDEESTKIQFSTHSDTIGEMLMLTHGSYLAAHLMYVTYGIHKFQFTLPIATVVTGSVAFAEITVVNVIFNPTLIYDEEVTRGLKQKVYQYSVKSNNTFDMSYDYISVWLQCCGILDQYDFLHRQSFYYNKPTKGGKSTQLSLQLAPTCCKRSIFKLGIQEVERCAIASTEHYTKGCFTKVVEYIGIGCMYYTAVVWVHLLDCFFHCSIYKKKVATMSRMMEYKSETKDQMVEFLLKQKLKQEMFEMSNMTRLFGQSKKKGQPKVRF